MGTNKYSLPNSPPCPDDFKHIEGKFVFGKELKPQINSRCQQGCPSMDKTSIYVWNLNQIKSNQTKKRARHPARTNYCMCLWIWSGKFQQLQCLPICVCVCVTYSHSNWWRSLNTPGLREDIKFSLRNLRESRKIN